MDMEYFMKEAFSQALLAYELKEVPIGAVIVHGNKVIAKGYNTRNISKNALMHAEITAIARACDYMKDWRLEDCHMFVTVEPCPMCAGAIVQARIKTLVYGCENKKAGSCGSIINLLDNDSFNHKVDIIGGVLRDECSYLMSDFFRNLRISGSL